WKVVPRRDRADMGRRSPAPLRVGFEIEARRRDRREIPRFADSVRNDGGFWCWRGEAGMREWQRRWNGVGWLVDMRKSGGEPPHSKGGSFVAPLRRLHVIEGERLFSESGGATFSLVFPGGDVGVVGVVAHRLALGCLIPFAEVTTAGFLAVQRVQAHEFGEFEEVGHAAGSFEG